MNLTLRFGVLVFTLVAAVGASAYAGHSALTRLDAAITSIVDNDFERLLAITHTRRLFRSMFVQERDLILAKTEAERVTMDKKLATSAMELLEQVDKYARLMPAEDAPVVANIRAVRERWIAHSERVRAAARVDQDAALALAKGHNSDPISWENEIGGLVKLSQKRLDDQVNQTRTVYLSAQSQLLWVSAGAALLALVLGGMIFAGIRRNMAEVVRLNTNLEGQVRARTEKLAERERSLRLVLDSTGDGLLEVDRAGLLTGASSAAAERWFGPASAGTRIAEYLYPKQPDQAGMFGVAFDQLVEDIMPWELCHDQMPKRLTVGASILELDWKRVMENDAFTKLLVIARDITDAVQSERAEHAAREQQSLITKLLQDKAGFAQFVKDCESLLASLGAGHDLVIAQRDLHTLKGNAGMFGLGSVAKFCHAIEDRIAQNGGLPDPTDIADLAALWRTRMQSIEAFLSDLSGTRLEVDLAEHARLITSLLERQDYAEILSMVELWSWQRTVDRLTRYRAYAEHLAQRFHKPVSVSLEHNDVRLPKDYLEKFWPTLIHVVRNAVDHAAEPSEERVAQGKSPALSLVFRTEQRDDALIVELRDDGPGIDRQALLVSARAKGVQAPDDISLLELVFMDGVSSRTQVSEISGRGVGLAAVRHACEAEGGTVEVVNEPGKGCSFRFEFRRPVVKAGLLAANLEKRWSMQSPPKAANSNQQRDETKLG
jgi:HPt (histidine-containing phosphotransfer) domain-containing protein